MFLFAPKYRTSHDSIAIETTGRLFSRVYRSRDCHSDRKFSMFFSSRDFDTFVECQVGMILYCGVRCAVKRDLISDVSWAWKTYSGQIDSGFLIRYGNRIFNSVLSTICWLISARSVIVLTQIGFIDGGLEIQKSILRVRTYSRKKINITIETIRMSKRRANILFFISLRDTGYRYYSRAII